MSDPELELLVTMDDPGEEQQADIFNHLQAEDPSVLAWSNIFWILPAGPTSSDRNSCTLAFGSGRLDMHGVNTDRYDE